MDAWHLHQQIKSRRLGVFSESPSGRGPGSLGYWSTKVSRGRVTVLGVPKGSPGSSCPGHLKAEGAWKPFSSSQLFPDPTHHSVGRDFATMRGNAPCCPVASSQLLWSHQTIHRPQESRGTSRTPPGLQGRCEANTGLALTPEASPSLSRADLCVLIVLISQNWAA